MGIRQKQHMRVQRPLNTMKILKTRVLIFIIFRLVMKY